MLNMKSVSRNSLALALAVVIVGAGIGWIAGRAIKPASASGPISQIFGMYSYDDSSCNVIVDPIGIVFTNGNGWLDHPYQHAKRSDHGGWSTGWQNPGQYFSDDFGCSSGDGEAANGSYTRHHMRWELAWTTDAGYAYEATPHYEEWVWDNFLHITGHHCVHPGGFNQGQSGVIYQWQNLHTYMYPSFWGNNAYIVKCDGEFVRGTGGVTYIDMHGYDEY